MFGLGASLAGTALYAVILLVAHLQLSLIAIVVGVMVGKAVLKGARGCQGKRYQILAVALTYFSITSSFVPVVIAAYAKKHPASSAPANQPTEASRKLTPGGAVVALTVGLVALTALSLVSPFLELSSGFGGILNLIIIGIGLRQAWRLTRPDEAAITGPYAP